MTRETAVSLQAWENSQEIKHAQLLRRLTGLSGLWPVIQDTGWPLLWYLSKWMVFGQQKKKSRCKNMYGIVLYYICKI